jgi:hypothetical protein
MMDEIYDLLPLGIERLAERLPDATWVDLQQFVNKQVLFRVGAEIDINPQIWHDKLRYNFDKPKRGQKPPMVCQILEPGQINTFED